MRGASWEHKSASIFVVGLSVGMREKEASSEL